MNTSVVGRRRIERREGIELTAYKHRGDVWTIGYGHTRGVKQGDVITSAQADAFLVDDLRVAESAVRQNVHVPLTQDQFDALVSFAFNEGGGALATSTLCRVLNTGDYRGAALHFFEWNKKDDGTGHLIVAPELIARRLEEVTQFYGSDPRDQA